MSSMESTGQQERSDALPALSERDSSPLDPSSFYASGRDPIVDGLLGLAVGDAFGVPYEFMSRQQIGRLHLDEMLGCDKQVPFLSQWGSRIPSGAWSDDTSMTVAAMDSFIQNKGQVDYEDIMRRFLLWWNKGMYASCTHAFGLGGTVGDAFHRFRCGAPALQCGGTGIRDNGNGALMRLFPFSMICILRGYGDAETLDLVRKAASITHGHEICAMSCYLYTLFLRECLRTGSPQSAYAAVFFDPFRQRDGSYADRFSPEAIEAHSIFRDYDLRDAIDLSLIHESGYVVDSLIAAVYSLVHSETYEDTVKTAVRLGYDTDTNAAIAGSIAGALYGQGQIPPRWLDALRKRDYLIQIGKDFSAALSL